MKPYLYIAKMRILSALAYRFDVFSTIVVQCIIMISTVFFWSAAYGTNSLAAGTTKEQMITYMIMSAVLGCILRIGVEGRVHKSIRDGRVAVDMIKPVNIFGMYLAEDLGSLTVTLFVNALPLILVASIFVKVPVPASFGHFCLFLFSCALSYAINWFISVCFSMIAFWIVNIGPLSLIKSSIIRILSGSLVPIWFFPEWMQGSLKCLPFMYIYQLPLSIYIGRLTPTEMLFQLCVQLVWVGLLYGLYSFMKSRVMSNVMVQGG